MASISDSSRPPLWRLAAEAVSLLARAYRAFGRLGWQVSEIGFGTWGMGGWSGADDALAGEALDLDQRALCF